MSEKVRVRFAPSPTGPLHIGGLRTALYNYLFAKRHGGDFVVRIEDTDKNRYVSGAEKYVIESLEWCGIVCDESPQKKGQYAPYRQSERKDIYKKYIDILIEKGAAYHAFDTASDLDFHRKSHEKKGKTFIYNWHNREKLNNSLSLEKHVVTKKIHSGQPYVIRFKTPVDKLLTLQDEIRGTIKIDTRLLDDKILFKSDGMPTYHLANVVDDHLMKMTHIIRGEEWLPSLALHVLLYKAFGWDIPKFAHLPLILKPSGKGKLSKREGDKMGFPVFPLNYTDPITQQIAKGYKEEGYFSEAFVNMLAMLGWNDGTDREIFSIKQLIENFSLERVNKAGARFSIEKAKWFNAQYLQSKPSKELAQLFLPSLKAEIKEENLNISLDKTAKVIDLIKQRAVFVKDFWELGNYFFVNPKDYHKTSVKKIWTSEASSLMKELYDKLLEIEDFSSKNIQICIKQWIASKKMNNGAILQPLRLCLVGALQGADLFKIMDCIGKGNTLQRIKNAVEKLG